MTPNSPKTTSMDFSLYTAPSSSSASSCTHSCRRGRFSFKAGVRPSERPRLTSATATKGTASSTAGSPPAMSRPLISASWPLLMLCQLLLLTTCSTSMAAGTVASDRRHILGVASPMHRKRSSDSPDQSIKILQVEVPRFLKVGETAMLHCRVSWTGDDELYSLKWWKDNDQFYQFVPKNEEPMMTFNVTGINVDMAASSQSNMVLRNVSVRTSGRFTCEVMAEGSFETLGESAYMDVIDPPDGRLPGMEGPIIEVDGVPVGDAPLEYMENQIVKANCQARRSHPPANLAWFINNNKMPDMSLRRRDPWPDGNTYTSSLAAMYRIAEDDFDKDGQLELKCEATIGDFYSSHSNVVIHNPIMRKAKLSGLFSAVPSIHPSSFLFTLSLLLASFCLSFPLPFSHSLSLLLMTFWLR